MRRIFLAQLRQFVHHPLTQLGVALILVGSSISEVIEDVAVAGWTWRIGVHHGVLAYGLMQVLQCLPPLVEGFERWCKVAPPELPRIPPGGE